MSRTKALSLLSLCAVVFMAVPFLRAEGFTGTFVPEPEPEGYRIGFSNGFTIDTRYGEPSLPARYRIDAPGEGRLVRIVQFTGPVRQDWLRQLRRMGIKTFGYLPHYAVMAKLDPAQCEDVRGLASVAWVGIFQPAYKLEEKLLNASGIRKVVVQITPDEDYKPVTELLLKHSAVLDDITVNPAGVTITATFDAGLIPDLARLQEVMWMQEWGECTTCNNMGQWVTQTGWRNAAPSNTDTAARRVWTRGVRGQRIVLGVTDTGLNLAPTGHDMFRDPAMPVTPPGIWPGHRKVVAYKCFQGADAAEGQYHGSHVNGTVAGDDSAVGGASYYDGMAIKARLYFEDVTNGTSFIIPTNFWSVWDTVHASRGLPDSLRCYQHSGSWGWSNSSGTYLVQDASTDAYAWAHKDFLNIMAAGNEYNARTIRNPGIAKNVVTVGALQNGTLSNAIASFSSRGPTQDGRIKPTICAPGDLIYSSTRSPATNTYSSMSGTSMATPMTNGAVGLIRCYLKEGYYPSGAKTVADTFGYISSALLRSMAIVSADPNVGSYVVPDNNIGWGRIDIDSVLYFAGDKRRLMLRDDTVGLSTGQFYEYTFRADSSTIPLRICLTWTDTAGAVNANPTLVNNLDLLVTAPGGATYYRGNQYTSGQSTVNPSNWDNLNTEECVRVNSPAVGTWTLRVNASNVVTARQPYAYSITGAVSPASAAVDVQTVAIVAPTGTVNQGTVIAPSATVRNNGTTPQTFTVKFTVGAGYADSVTIANLGAGTTTTATFANWTAGPLGSLATSCSTRLAGDLVSSNDKVTGTVFVQSLDAQTVAIVAPTGTVNQGTVIAPSATVRNNGNTTQTFTVKFVIGAGYADSVTITGLGAGATTTATFANWTAGPLGLLATSCSTRLTGDMTQSNDKATGSVFVQSLDAQTVSIIGPTGTVNQGTVIAPSATVRNNGNTTQTFTVKFVIGAGYADSVTITNLGAGATTTATFANWTAGPLGSLATSCSTRLAGDLVSSNDKVTGTVFVQSLDAQTVAIVAPTGTVNQGTVIAPSATVRNNGNTTQTFTVKFVIGAGYADSVTIANLGAGATTTATFANWTAGPLGSLATSCSTRLAGDMNSSNNKATGTVFVQSLDAQTVAIVAPTGTVNQGTVIAPSATVRNNGNTTQTFMVKFVIGAGYADSVTITGLGAGATTTATFANWTAGPLGSLVTSCSTRLAGDMNSSNNKAMGTVFVQSLDAQTVAIVAPTGTVNQGTVIAPSATVRNNGNTTQTFTVKFVIGAGYADSVTITGLGAGATTTATFANWTAGPLGSLATSCSTRLAGDMNSSNNKATGTVFVQNLDAEAVSIVAPSGALDSGTVVTPEANVRNNGNVSVTFDVQLDIGSAYTDTQTVAGLAPGAQQTVTFAPWTARQRSAQPTRCTTRLAGDVLPGNDLRTGSVDVRVHDIGAVAIVAPADTVAPGGVLPQATVRNYGTDREACSFVFMIDAPTPYRQTVNLPAGVPMADTVIEFPGWFAAVGRFTATCSTLLANDQVRANDVIAAPFVVRFGGGPGWSRVADVPPGARSKSVRDGGALTFGEENTDANDTGYVYAFKGNNTFEFYRYNTLTGEWLTRESIPAYNRNSRKKGVKKGSSLAMAADGKVYATKGSSTLDFWVYDPATRRWTQLTDAPLGAKMLKEGVGTAAVRHGGIDYIYLLKGSATVEFYRYNVRDGVWDTSLPTAPGGASGKSYKNGSSIAFDGGDTVWCLKGTYNEFAAYSIAGRNWITRNPLPLIAPPGTKKVKAKDGSQIASDGGRLVYALKGANSNEFWGYQADEATWSALPAMPTVVKRVKGGGALTYAGSLDVLYALRGNNTREFWTYNPGSAPGFRNAAVSRPKDGQGQSAVRTSQFALSIAPNPFTSHQSPATIRYSLPVAGNISLKLYDVTGKLVSTLAGGYHAAGSYSSPLTASSSQLAAGIYVIRLDSGSYHATEKLIIE